MPSEPWPRTCKQRAGQTTPAEGSALTTTTVVVKLTRNPTRVGGGRNRIAAVQSMRTPEEGADEQPRMLIGLQTACRGRSLARECVCWPWRAWRGQALEMSFRESGE
jgi:hypothetical protein